MRVAEEVGEVRGSWLVKIVSIVLCTVIFTGFANAAEVIKTNNADGDSFFTEFEFMSAGSMSVNFQVEVTNTSATDALVVNSLIDDVHGNLNTQGNCPALIGSSVAPSSTASCIYSVVVNLPTEGTSERSTVTANISQSGSTEALTAVTTVGVLRAVSGPVINDIFYIPYPEDQILADLVALRAGGGNACGDGSPEPANPVTTVVGLTVLAEDTIIYYDHIEDGFEPFLENPVQPTTEIWGDGDTSNGTAPGFASDIIPAGSEIVLRNDVTTTTIDTVIDIDGGDKIAGSLPLAATRAAWSSGPETLLAGALEMYNTNEQWGTTYQFPVGENFDRGQAYEFVAASVIAQLDNTVVNVDANADGDFTDPGDIAGVVINEGESVHINGGILLGGTVTASEDVRVDLITGDICENYESRFLTLFPREAWSNNYYNPVVSEPNTPLDTPANAVVTLYNPQSSAINVSIELADGSGGVTGPAPVNVPAGTIVDYTMPSDSGARFFTDPTQNGGASPEFYAVVAVDQDNDIAESSAADWGITLVPRQFLSTQVLVGTGIGRDPDSPTNPAENGSPIWLTAAKNGSDTAIGGIDVCIDYDGDGQDSAADVSANQSFYNQGVDDQGDADPTTGTGREFDNVINMDVFESTRIFDPDGDQSGMLLFVCDSDLLDQREGVITAAWGQDGSVASPGQPGLDIGTGIPNIRAILVSKRSAFKKDVNGDGDANVGDLIRYEISVTNTGLVPIATLDIDFSDLLPTAFLEYQANSTTLTRVDPFDLSMMITETVPDDVVPPRLTIFPLDQEGTTFYQIPTQIGIGESVLFGYTTQVIDVPFAPDEICNTAEGMVFNEFDDDEDCVDVSVNSSLISGFVRDDVDGDGVGDVGIENAIVQLYSDPLGTGNPADGTQQRTVLTDATGFYEFDDLQAGDYIVVEVDPAGYFSVSDLDESSTNDVDAVSNPNLNDNIIPVSVAQAEAVGDPNLVLEARDIENNFVDARTGLISGLVWLDEDQDGINDIEEAGLTNVTVELRDGVCVPASTCPTVLTDQFGNYVFSGLLPGDYDIAVISGLPPSVTPTAGPFNPQIRPVTLIGGQEITDQDFGYIANPNTGIIGDRVWSDADGDGIQDAGEAGLAGVTLQLLDANGNPTGATSTTNADGDYLFTNIPFGEDYSIEITDTAGVLSGFTPTVGPQSEGGALSNPVTLSPALTTVTDIDFGFDSPATLEINDRIWYDADGDQTQDAGEPGIAGVSVELVDASGNIVATAVTDENGDFSFAGVPEGANYALVISDRDNQLNGLTETTSTDGDETIAGSLAGAAGGDNSLNTIGDDGSPTFGFNNPGSIAGTVWSDADSNEVQNGAEPGLGGIQVRLTPPADVDLGAGPGQAITVMTLADGSYLFDGLPAGDYVVDIPSPPAGVHTQDPDGDDDNNAVITLNIGESAIGQDFGYADPNVFNISGTVFLDTDKDGVEEPDGVDGLSGTADDEPGFEGVTLALSGGTGARIINGLFDVNDDGVIDASDDGSFAGVAVIDGSLDINGDGAISEADGGKVRNFDVIEGMVNLAQAGVASQSSTFTIGSPELANDGITAGGFGIGQVAHTDDFSDTEYWQLDLGSVQNINAVKVFNREDCCTDRLGNVFLFVADTPFPDNPRDLIGAQINADFTAQLPADTTGLDPSIDVNISGRYIRLQKSGTNPGGDAINIAEVKVTPSLIEPTRGIIATTVTDADGNYLFPDLPDGDYMVAVTDEIGLLAGYDITSGLDQQNVFIAGADVMDVDFGYIKDEATGSITGEVFIDESLINGIADDPETNLAGVTIYLCAAADAPCTSANAIATTTTDALGEYGFANLPAGQYAVGADPATVPPSLDLTVDPAPINLSEGENVTEVDIGYQAAPNTGTLSGFVWIDVDSDGIYDSAEAPIPGVDIFIYGPENGTTLTLLATGTTGPNGQWIVTGISGANLRNDIIVTYDDADIPAVLESSQPTNLPLGDDLYNPVNLLDDVNNDDGVISYLDFAFPPNAVGGDLGSIQGTIYSDTNEDGDYSAASDGELQGVTVNLLDGSGNIIATTMTDQNGVYLFDGLIDGDYQIVITDRDKVLRDLNPNEVITNPITIVGAADITDQDAGYISDPDLGSIGNRFWFDINGDGRVDDNEPGVEGVIVQAWLDNDTSETADDPSVATGAPQPGVDNLVRTVVTDENGEYYLTSLPVGQYIVMVMDAGDFTEADDATNPPTLMGAETGAEDELAKPWVYALTKVSGTPNLAADFGVTGSNQLSGNVFIEDETLIEPDGNGAIDVGELDGTQGGISPDVPAAGVIVLLSIQRPDGSFDQIQTTTTDAAGNYSFTGLPDGTYRVEVLPSGSVIDGFGQTGDPDIANETDPENRVCDSSTAALCDDTHTISLSGSGASGIDFGYQRNFVTTPVTINLFESIDNLGTVTFVWESSNEVGHVGYQLYARTEDQWMLLNQTLINSDDEQSALATRRYSYSADVGDAQWFALIDVSATEELTIHGPYKLGQRYGDQSQPIEAFDWSTLKLPKANTRAAAQAVQSRVDRLRQLEGESNDNELQEEQAFEHSSTSEEVSQ